jgi:hypothetical protein
MIAALFVQPAGAYFGIPGVDLWDEARDARKYVGPHAVVAHPPCGRWCKPLAKVNQTRYGHKIGDDGGAFRHALTSVLVLGGVLEHPANSYAWDVFHLRKPKRGSWQYSIHDGYSYFVTEVSQSAYGHKARKNTWLIYVGHMEPPTLDWSDPKGTHLTSWLQRTSRDAPRITKKEADKTPPAFRDLLLSLATLSGWSTNSNCSPECTAPTEGDCIRDGRSCLAGNTEGKS